MRRLLFAVCLMIAGLGGIGFGSTGHALAGPAPNYCGSKGTALCFIAGAAGSAWNLTLYGEKLKVGTFVNYSYSTVEGGGSGSAVVPKGGSIAVTVVGSDLCPAISLVASANGTSSKGAPVSTSTSSPAVC